MRVLMLEPPARDQHAGFDQRLDHRVVGVALFAVVGENALAGEARRLVGEAPVGVDGVGNNGVDAARQLDCLHSSPDFEVLATMSRRGVDETSAGIVGDVTTFEERHLIIVIARKPSERMRTRHSLKFQ